MAATANGNIPRLVIGGTHSGVGKTTITGGIVAAFRQRGRRVQPFKCGPDYIDPGYLTLLAGLPCRNLDSWMLPREALIELFTHTAVKADIAVVEGVMGLYDGRDGLDYAGSTAEVARWLDAPVVLIINVAKMSGSAAAMALGYRQLDPEVKLAGVILNNIGSPKHLRWATEAVEKKAGLPVFGYLPKNAKISVPERHLGLVPTAESGELGEYAERLTAQTLATVDVDGLLNLAQRAAPLPEVSGRLFPRKEKPARVNIAVARDEAFNFYYQDNLDLLTAWGARLTPVSPLHDAGLPPEIDGIYIGGGFPEMYAGELEANAAFRKAVAAAAQAGMPLYAECGGLMYLSQGITGFQNERHAMVGLVPAWTAMQPQRTRIGYATVSVLRDNILGHKGERLRGHLFHWSKLPDPTGEAAYRILDSENQREGFVLGPEDNILASYLHLHFGSLPALAKRFIAACARWSGRGPGRSA